MCPRVCCLLRAANMKVFIVALVLAACSSAMSAAVASASSSSSSDQPEDIGSPLTVAQCRAQCLQRVRFARPPRCLTAVVYVFTCEGGKVCRSHKYIRSGLKTLFTSTERPTQCLQSPDCYMGVVECGSPFESEGLVKTAQLDDNFQHYESEVFEINLRFFASLLL
ncbi:hypothetical protein FOCC_FOCC013025 [Frankliniella occidentalis]|nr:hypothetical protein FOCC_FOCC013025 [Frankliniella occidentalis]